MCAHGGKKGDDAITTCKILKLSKNDRFVQEGKCHFVTSGENPLNSWRFNTKRNLQGYYMVDELRYIDQQRGE